MPRRCSLSGFTGLPRVKAAKCYLEPMSRLLVCPLSGLGDALESHRPSHLVTLLSPQHMILTPPGFDPARHLRLGVEDVSDPQGADTPPGRAEIDRLLA